MSKKRNGKVKVRNFDEKATTNEIDGKIKSLVDEILSKYNYKKCLVIVGDPDEIPVSLYELLEGRGVYGLNSSNLESKYQNYQHGKYDAYKFMCAVESLLDNLVMQFDNLVDSLVTGSFNYKEDYNYERS